MPPCLCASFSPAFDSSESTRASDQPSDFFTLSEVWTAAPAPPIGKTDTLSAFVSAGEPSGDAIAGPLVEELVARGANCAGVGGPAMRTAGLKALGRTESLSAIGFAEVVTSIPNHVRLARTITRAWHCHRPDVVVLVDYPGFHLRLARFAARRRLPVLYYVAPQLWAWHPSRAKRMRQTVSHVATILPFEETFFQRMGIPATFVGNPLRDRPGPDRDVARRAVGAGDRPVVALFPGARRTETSRLGPLFDAAAQRIRMARPDVMTLTGRREGPLREGECPSSVAAAAADAALCKSGTITLETALAGTPMVIAYRTMAATHWLAKRLIRVPFIGLPNLLLERPVVPELIQDDATPDALASAVLRLLDDPKAADAQREAFQALAELLGPPGVAGRVADLASHVAGV